nr:MAG TPA: hypothetical protein [Caudoviricetes sp.]
MNHHLFDMSLYMLPSIHSYLSERHPFSYISLV